MNLPPCVSCGRNEWEWLEEDTQFGPFQRPKCPCGYVVPTPRPGPQLDFVLSQARYPGIFAGRRSGKTFAGAIKLWLYAHNHPGALMFASQPSFAKFETVLLPTFRELFGKDEVGRGGDTWIYREKKGQIYFKHLDVTVHLLSAEGMDHGTGSGYAAGWMDELGLGNQRDFFYNLQLTLSQKGYPHQIWCTSTPKVDFPWIKKTWVDGVHPLTDLPLEDREGRYPIYRMHTKDNPDLDDELRVKLLLEWADTKLAAQELAGEFVAVEGAAFPDLSEFYHRKDPGPEIVFKRTVGGLDFGGTNPTALYEIREDTDGRLWVTREFYKRNSTEVDWLTTAQEWGLKKIICDPAASEKDLIEYRRRWHVNIQRSNVKRFDHRKMLWNSRLAVRAGEPTIFISNQCPNLWDELTNLQHARPKGREYDTDSWTPGASDHAYDAVAYGMSEFARFLGAPKARPLVRTY